MSKALNWFKALFAPVPQKLPPWRLVMSLDLSKLIDAVDKLKADRDAIMDERDAAVSKLADIDKAIADAVAADQAAVDAVVAGIA